MGWNYLSIPKLDRYGQLFMMGLKLIHVSKRAAVR